MEGELHEIVSADRTDIDPGLFRKPAYIFQAALGDQRAGLVVLEIVDEFDTIESQRTGQSELFLPGIRRKCLISAVIAGCEPSLHDADRLDMFPDDHFVVPGRQRPYPHSFISANSHTM